MFLFLKADRGLDDEIKANEAAELSLQLEFSGATVNCALVPILVTKTLPLRI